MSRTTAMAVVLLPVAVGGLLITWRLGRRNADPVPAHVLIIDRSASTSSPCDAVGDLIEDIVRRGAITARSTVYVLTTGDESTRNEPVLLGTLRGLKGSRAMEGKAAAATRREQLIAKVVQACRVLPPTRSSPIFLGLRRGLEMLHATGCARSGGRCTLIARTDGEETEEAELRRMLGSRGPRLESARVPRLDNAGVSVDLCGLADVTGGPKGHRAVHTARSADRVASVWAAAFREGALVRIAPTCATRSTPNKART